MEELWFILVVTISLALLLKAFLDLLSPSKSPPPLPPGPFSVPILSQFLWIRKISSEMEPILRSLHAKLGPIIALNIVSRPSIFISDRSLAYQALIHNGLVFSDRPEPLATGKVLSCNQHNINSAGYGPTWRLLRRNLTSQILHPHRIKSYSRARNSVLQILFDNLDSESKNGGSIRIMAHFQYAMFCLLVLMCFGDQVSEEQIKQIEVVQREVLLNSGKFNYLNFWPKLTRLLLGKKWEQFLNIRKSQQQVLIPLIRARREYKNDDDSLTYVDTLLDLKLPEEDNNRMRRQLTEEEMVALCSEFLNAGTDTTSTALQWIMANLVKYPHIQDKLFREIQGVVVVGEEIKEDDLQKMPYLKAVVLEGLRRHPPGHFVLPHTVTEDTVLGGYLVPKGSNINFMVADMGWDPRVWEDPMAFKPERFDGGGGQVFDITASKGEIKMMPFGAGRRICPGIGLAMLHLEYLLANLVWKFEWKAVEGDEVSLDEKQEFTIVMKYPLQAHISPRERRK